MIQSMTGYGRGNRGCFGVEVRASNYRYLDIQIKMPQSLYFYETELRRLIRERFSRGRFEVLVSKTGEDGVKIKINRPLAKELYNAINSLKAELFIPGDIGIEVLTSQKDIFTVEKPVYDTTDLIGAFNEALNELEKLRVEEGKSLTEEIVKRVQLIKEYLKQIEDKRADSIANTRTLLMQRLKEFLGNTAIDDSRLIQEVALLVDKSDITEELVRIKVHIRQIEHTIKEGGFVGKKIDFFLQEINREVNTIGSKACSSDISVAVVEIKSELEKIREQVQNLQ